MMTKHRLMVARCGARAAVLALLALPAAAQRQPQEFTLQGVYVSNFWVRNTDAKRAKEDFKFGRAVGDAVRDRVEDILDKREAKVIEGWDIRDALTGAGFSADTSFSLRDLHVQAKFFRTDELIVGTATRLPAGVRIEAHLVLYRDLKMRQPLPPVSGRDINAAAKALAAQIRQARTQLAPQRRCENSLREGAGTRAIEQAREGVALYPGGALVRTCLARALQAMGHPAEEYLAEAKHVLEVDPFAPRALEVAAMALDTLKRRPEAAEMWLRLAATDSADAELIERIVYAMAEHGNSRRAEPLIIRLSDEYPDNMRLQRQKWRIANDNRNWPLAVRTGEVLLAKDPEALKDATFFLRLATAYRSNGQPFESVETVARAVHLFPLDARLYAVYTQFIKEEADTVIGRGMLLYPKSAELLTLNAKDLRSKGKVAEALDASKKAIELDSTIAQGRILIAQSEIELGRPDSALLTLKRAVAAGENRNSVAQFVLSKGNVFFKAASGTKSTADFQLALRYLAYADTLKPTPQTKFLLGAVATNVAQMALTDAPKITVKEESCVMAQVGAGSIPLARASLEAGADVAPEVAKQFLEYLDVMAPFADKQLAAFCGNAKPDTVPPAKP